MSGHVIFTALETPTGLVEVLGERGSSCILHHPGKMY